MVSPAVYTSPIPEGVDDAVAGPIMCSGSTMYRSIAESGLKANQWAVFLGAGGGVGHMGVQIARALGTRVIGIDNGADKRELCMKLGCEVFIDFSQTKDVVEEVIKATGGLGAHGIFISASSKSAYATATRMCRVGGRVMCIGIPPLGQAFVGDDPNVSPPCLHGRVSLAANDIRQQFIFKNIHVIGTLVGSMADTNEALQLGARVSRPLRDPAVAKRELTVL